MAKVTLDAIDAMIQQTQQVINDLGELKKVIAADSQNQIDVGATLRGYTTDELRDLRIARDTAISQNKETFIYDSFTYVTAYVEDWIAWLNDVLTPTP